MKHRQHERGFRITSFTNSNGTPAFRVQGWLRGKRVRENFPTVERAEARKLELEHQRLGLQAPEILRATWLTSDQLAAAESVFTRIPAPDEVRKAVDFWLERGKAQSKATEHANDIRLDDALMRFKKYLTGAANLRESTRRNLRNRVAMFVSEVGNLTLQDVTPETVEAWLDGRHASPTTKDNDRRAVGRFFQWCVDRPQRFIITNPCREVRVALPERDLPEIYTLPEVMRLLVAAKRFRGGRFLKFIALQLFGGMRPTEALRFRDSQVVDGHIRIEGRQSKTGRPRTIEADPVLLAWLKVSGEGPVSNWQKSRLLWDGLKRKAKLARWIPDGLRHTAISHHFRRSGSYGLTAEWAGNSEPVIRAHYQARTTAADSERYWALFPARTDRRATRPADDAIATDGAQVVAFPRSKAA